MYGVMSAMLKVNIQYAGQQVGNCQLGITDVSQHLAAIAHIVLQAIDFVSSPIVPMPVGHIKN
jgi:hypothetical protein